MQNPLDSGTPNRFANFLPQRTLQTAASQPVSSDGMCDGEKTRAMLLFSGMFLGLVGVTFTAMGWLSNASNSYEWPQLLGPIVLSFGGTFMLLSVCKFGKCSDLCCTTQEEGDVNESRYILPGCSFVVNGTSHPAMVPGATVVPQYIPPPNASVAQEVTSGGVVQPNSSSHDNGSNRPPHYYTVFPLDNPAFTIEQNSLHQNPDVHQTK